jgi:hypothetical protein
MTVLCLNMGHLPVFTFTYVAQVSIFNGNSVCIILCEMKIDA